MKASRFLVLALFILSCGIAAFANSAPDPIIKIKDPTCTSRCADIQGTHFSFSTPPSGSGVLSFTNQSGVDWTSLKLVESGTPASAITCITTIFASCSVFSVNGNTVILLKAGGDFSGITNNMVFTITFTCFKGCWPGNEKFTATTNVPEPGTIALMMTGIGGIITRRKWLARPAA